MNVSQSLSGLGSAFLQSLQSPQSGASSGPSGAAGAAGAASATGAVKKGQVALADLDGARQATETGRIAPRGSFLDLKA